MWEHTARLAATWARVTLALTVGLVLVFVLYGWGSTELTLAALLALFLDLLVTRALWREWTWQARGTWWRRW